MEFQDVVRRRRMVRTFDPRPVPPEVVDRILDNAVRAPSAGFTQGWAFLVLQGFDETERFWSATFREGKREWCAYPGLFDAPLIIVPLSHKQAYLDRYAEPDKGRAATLGRGPAAWPQPLWWFDAGAAAEALLLQARDEGLGACLFGLFGHEAAVLDALGVPAGWRGARTAGRRSPAGRGSSGKSCRERVPGRPEG